ncbi:hypothetical protein EJ05DRAFT_503116 [Pseudovirgaria hyperparasitica]|uniref:Uncharacterized protein n=1 Tax=Pseudovirgaria hyperparasitica TaxID=470096 RepID=A0A6A6VYC4_9PEZI|nr:uncharacterized protein EJ05DRAFT_503116 [Pseudovirgaria hyperparasitica]KAF2755658.1 hypothetical protein EJ05DRAFT_503116 [Pseudovirgaria hyperparasitica]
MTSNRPFMANFFAAFRAQSVIQKTATSSTNASANVSASTYTHAASLHTSSNSPSPNASSNPRPIHGKNGNQSSGATTAAVQAAGQFRPTREHGPSPYSPTSNSPASTGFPLKSSANKPRRGSDSSSEGFRETMGADKWYIGGRTANGEEKFYRLGMVKKNRSIDRLSIDRLSI